MRCCAVAAGLTCAVVGAAFAQGPPAASAPRLLRRPARLDVRSVPRETALRQLGLRSGVSLAFSPTLLAGTARVSCACAQATVAQALDSILAGTGLVYLESGDRVIVQPDVGPPRDGSPAPETPARLRTGVLIVQVASTQDSQPVEGAEVLVSGRLGAARTDARGRGYLALAPGVYRVLVRALAFAPRWLEEVPVVRGETRSATVDLEPVPIALSEIVVTPGTYGVLRDERITPQLAPTREEVQTLPHFGEDIYRAVDRLPGITTANDVSAKFQIRGAPSDQTLVLLDGLELFEPFHLRDVDGIFSIIDVESVGEVDLIAGGFPAEFGGRMGGVFTMRTTTPDRTVTTLGASLSNLTAKSQGSIAGGRGAWLAAVRRGFLDILLDVTGANATVSPRYYDAFAKVQYQLGSRHLLAGHLLHAGDDLASSEDDGTELRSGWSSSYGWVTWQADFGDALSAQTLLSVGRVTRDRTGLDEDGNGVQTLAFDDHGTYDVVGLKQDWSLRASANWLMKWGFDARRGRADYDYFRWNRVQVGNTTDPSAPPVSERFDTVAVAAAPSGSDAAAYLAHRLRPVEPLTVELGLRYEHRTYTGDGALLSPRANLAVQVGPRTILRGAWGLYRQAQGLAELQVIDGDSRFYPAQRAEHRIVGLEHRLTDGLVLRAEAYQRRIAQPRPEYRRLAALVQEVPEEDPEQRVRVAPSRGRARGVELLVKHDGGGPVTWSAGYALAATEDEVGGRWVPRPQDQRHTLHAEVAWRPSPGWSLSWAWQYHSPWPATERRFTVDTLVNGAQTVTASWGPLNAERLPAYHRMDLRVSRHIPLGRGRLSLFLDVFNVYNRRNPVAYDYAVEAVTPGGRAIVSRRTEAPIGILPTLGARWDF